MKKGQSRIAVSKPGLRHEILQKAAKSQVLADGRVMNCVKKARAPSTGSFRKAFGPGGLSGAPIASSDTPQRLLDSFPLPVLEKELPRFGA